MTLLIESMVGSHPFHIIIFVGGRKPRSPDPKGGGHLFYNQEAPATMNPKGEVSALKLRDIIGIPILERIRQPRQEGISSYGRHTTLLCVFYYAVKGEKEKSCQIKV